MLDAIVVEIDDGRAPDLEDAGTYLLLGISCHFVEVARRYYEDYVGLARWYLTGDN